jgi:uncharacterized protein
MDTVSLDINVAQLLKEPQGSSRNYKVEDEIEDEYGVYSVSGEVKLTNENHVILVQANLSTGINLQCSRCAKSYTCPIRLEIVEEYHPTIDIQTGEKLLPPDESGAFTIDEHHVLDLAEALRQYRVIATPMKPLCSLDCAGMCPVCGKDLSSGPCECPNEHIDPRWTELLKLKNKASQTRAKGRSK